VPVAPLCYAFTMLKLTAQVKLLPAPDQHAALLHTLQQANAACNYISEAAWAEQAFGRVPVHQLTYYDVRATFNLTAQMAVRCIGKVVDAYKLDRQTKRTFRSDGATPYDDRILSWRVDQREVSIWTTAGRQAIPFAAGVRALELLKGQRGESDLCLVDGEFYLFATCEVETPEPQDVDEYLGVDLGVTNVAVDSDGVAYAPPQAHVNTVRHRHRRIRAKLQKKGTKSARRLLKKRRCKESRFAKDVNHCISKRIVAKAQDSERGIALEELGGIRDRVTARRHQRATLHSWSFHDLRSKIAYKAALAGVPVVAVDPRNTSRTCPSCGCVDTRNRPSQAKFLCVACGFAGLADHIAAIAIGRRAAVGYPLGAAIRGESHGLAASPRLLVVGS
jgi:putative transposase